MNFKKYSDSVEEAANNIHLKEASETSRKGKSRIRDRIVFGKVSWNEALTYLAIVQSGIIFLGLMDDVIINLNAFFISTGIPIELPLEITVVWAFAFIFGIFIFGLIAVRLIGTFKRAQEISVKMNPGMYLLWEQQEEIKEELKKLKESKK